MSKTDKLEKDRVITFVGAKQAKRGFKFLVAIPPTQCEKCEYHHVCIENLEVGRIYEVTCLRENVFPCPLHDEGVRVVEVVEADISAAIPSRMAVEGASIIFRLHECGENLCKKVDLCRPVGLMEGDKCVILAVEEKVECEEGLSLVKVKLRRVFSHRFQ
jgi:hypothetical protein